MDKKRQTTIQKKTRATLYPRKTTDTEQSLKISKKKMKKSTKMGRNTMYISERKSKTGPWTHGKILTLRGKSANANSNLSDPHPPIRSTTTLCWAVDPRPAAVRGGHLLRLFRKTPTGIHKHALQPSTSLTAAPLELLELEQMDKETYWWSWKYWFLCNKKL